jgi:GlpG protein
MRRIGFIEGSSDAGRFCDYLISQQIHAVAEPEGADSQRFAIWVKEEQRLEEAGQALQLYLADPADGRFAASKQAAAVRAQEEADRRRRLKNVKKLPRSSGHPLAGDRAPLTFAAIAVCVIAGFLTGFGNPRIGVDQLRRERPTMESRVYDALTFVNRHDVPPRVHPDTVPFISIRKGEVWRVLTPAILHGSIGHLAMNMMGLFFLGTAIERIHGARWLAVLLLGTALVSSLVQVYWPPALGGGVLFVGASGVTYGLFGFVLIRPRFDPSYPVRLPPMFQLVGLGFIVLGVLNVVPGIANGGHIGGLAAGMLFAALPPGADWRRRT